MYECRIKPNRVLGQLEYKGHHITKDWVDCEFDLSETNNMIECQKKGKIKEPKKLDKIDTPVDNTPPIEDIIEISEPEVQMELTEEEKDFIEGPRTLYEMTTDELLNRLTELGIDPKEVEHKTDDELIEEIEIAENM